MVSWLETDEAQTMTDAAFLAAVLRDGKPHTTSEIIGASFKERGCGITVHSRAADLRKKGFNIDCRCVGHKQGRAVYEYQLLTSLEEPQSSAFGDEPILARMATDAGRGSSSDAEQLTLALPGRVLKRERWA